MSRYIGKIFKCIVGIVATKRLSEIPGGTHFDATIVKVLSLQLMCAPLYSSVQMGASLVNTQSLFCYICCINSTAIHPFLDTYMLETLFFC